MPSLAKSLMPIPHIHVRTKSCSVWQVHEGAHLVRPADEIQIMFCQEVKDAVGAKCVRNPSIIFTPAFDLSRPVSGTSVGRGIRLTCSKDFNSGERPPCMHKICRKQMLSEVPMMVTGPHISTEKCSSSHQNKHNLALTFSSTSAATGRQLKQSVNIFHSLTLYRRLHSS